MQFGKQEQMFLGRVSVAFPKREHHKGDIIHNGQHTCGGSVAKQFTRPSLVVTLQIGVVHLQDISLSVTQHISVASFWRWEL